MKLDVLGLAFSGHNPDVLRRDNPIDTLDALSDESVFSHNLKHLLRTCFTAQGSETSARTASEDNSE
jgi:hypothetical protein